LNPEITKLFNKSQGEMGGGMSSMLSSEGFYITQYSIDAAGEINLPLIGKVMAAGSTVSELRTNIDSKIKLYVTDAITDVKLVSFKVLLLGELGTKGSINILNDRATLFDVLAKAGDITYNGNRKNVSIIRKINGKSKIYKFDITKRDMLSSNMFYIQPNDILYVEPLKSTIFRMRVADYTTTISIITSTVSVFLLIYNLSSPNGN
jgi:polysaccharide biosynthesis/export protein